MEEARLRQILASADAAAQRAADAPWESGVVDWDNVPKDPIEVVLERLIAVDQKLEALHMLLIDSGVLAGGALQAKLAEIARERDAAAEAARAAKREAARAEQQKTVVCARCAATVLQSDTFLSASGALCAKCHYLAEG